MLDMASMGCTNRTKSLYPRANTAYNLIERDFLSGIRYFVLNFVFHKLVPPVPVLSMKFLHNTVRPTSRPLQ